LRNNNDPKLLTDSYLAYKAAYDLSKKDKSKRGDTIALLGLAAFYQLPDAKLAPLVAVNPALRDVQNLGVKEREATAMKLYKEAAFSGDKFANFFAGEYLYIAFERNAENKDLAVRYLKAAIGKGHKQAAVWLARVEAGR
jgi:hypothetical protein